MGIYGMLSNLKSINVELPEKVLSNLQSSFSVLAVGGTGPEAALSQDYVPGRTDINAIYNWDLKY